MKSVIISIILLAAAATGVFVSATYIGNGANELIELTSSLPVESVDFSQARGEAEKIVQIWKKQRSTVIYLIDYREVDEVDMACKRLYNSIRGEDICTYLICRDDFIQSLNRLLDVNLFTLENIL